MSTRVRAGTASRFAVLMATATLCTTMDPAGAVAWQTASGSPAVSGAPPRWEIGVGLLSSRAVGEFAEFVGDGTGFALTGLRNLGDRRKIALRIDLTLVSYGRTSESHALILGGAGVDVDVTTENVIATLALGPDLVVGQGPVRPYIGASIGSAQFVTTTAAWSGDQPVPIATTEIHERYALALAGGGGVRMRFREQARHPISVELDGRYRRHGRVEYLREGGVRERSDGSIELDKIVSDANLWTFQVSALIGVR